MTKNDAHEKIIDQLALVVERAQEVFVDRLEASVNEGKLGGGEMEQVDKRKIERLFSETVYGHVLAETLAIFGFVIHAQTKDNSILTRLAPSFLSGCDAKFKDLIPESATEKTRDLRQRAVEAMETHEGKADIVKDLIDDIANMHQLSPLRASYDAVVLALLGE